MSNFKIPESAGLTRRDVLKLSGLALGGLAVGGGTLGLTAGQAHADNSCTDNSCTCPDGPTCSWDNPVRAQQYSYFEGLDPFYPFSDTDPFSETTKTTIPPLGEDELRITFLGSAIPIRARGQMMMSIFVEVGWDPSRQMPRDQFVFDCGSGVSANYEAMNIGLGRMDKIFLTHLHGDHMSDLIHIYCFGPASDRKSPLYVWGPGPSGVESPPGSGKYYDDGTQAFCANLRAACRWHSESFSFQTTSYTPYTPPTQASWGLPYTPVPVGDDAPNDSYAMVPIELDWTKYGKTPGDNVAYHNPTTGVKITHFPVIHDRKGSVGYKLEWNGLSLIYTGDTKPEIHSRDQAINGGKGVDVLIHEMVVPAEIWAMKMLRLTDPAEVPPEDVQQLQTVQNSSHTPQGAFGYLLSQITPRPRLTVATHFPTADDTVACAMKSVQAHCNVVQGRDPLPQENAARITWSADLMVITVSKNQIRELRGDVANLGFVATYQPPPGTLNTPKYHYPNQSGPTSGDPYAQIDTSTEIPACGCNNTCNYREDGY